VTIDTEPRVDDDTEPLVGPDADLPVDPGGDEPLAPEEPPQVAPAEGQPRWWRWAGWVLALAVVSPILLTGVVAWSRTWYPAGDWAMTELAVRDVGGPHTPLVGPYSRYGWNHPGPLLFWLLAVPYRLAGGSSSAMLVAAAVVNSVGVGGTLLLAWRRGRLGLLALTAAALALCANSFGPELLRDPWNAWVTVLPFALLVMAAWSAVEGDRLGLLALPVVGSFLSQSHVGFVPFLVVLGVTGLVGFVRRRPGWRWPAIAGGVLVACWSPVILDTVLGGDNLSLLLTHFSAGRDSAGFETALGIAARELGGWAPWLVRGEEANPFGGALLPGPLTSLIVPVAAMIGAFVIAWRRDPAAVRFLGIVSLTAVAAVLAVSRISGGVFDYLVRWWWPLAALWWVAVAWAVGRGVAAFVAPRVRAEGPLARHALLVVVAGMALVVAGSAIDVGQRAETEPLPAEDWGPALAAVSPVDPAIPRTGPVLLRNVGPLAGWAFDAYAVQLSRAGVDVRVDNTGIARFKVGDHRLRPAEGDGPVLWLVTGSWIADFERELPGRRLDLFDPLSPPERQLYIECERNLRIALDRGGRPDLAAALDEGQSLWGAAQTPGVNLEDLLVVEEGRQRGVPLAIYLVDGPHVPLPEHRPV
jgi:hypothetical protein